MRIGIDARMLGKGYGIGRYLEALITHLAAQDTTHTFVIFVPKYYDVSTLQLGKHCCFVMTDIPWYSLAEQCRLPGLIRAAHVDLMHFPHWNVPILYKGPFVVTIHDLTMFHYPRPEATTRGPLVYWIKDRIHRFVVKHVVQKALHIITPSQWVTQDVQTTFGTSIQKITTVYEAPTLHKAEHVKGEKYVLYVGAAYPHKNLAVLLRAWSLVEQVHDDVTLVLVGKESPFYERLKQCPEWKTLQRVTHLGFVSDTKLSSLYASAAAFVCPSLSEGFGIPPLEAMQQGTPVIAATTTCVP